MAMICTVLLLLLAGSETAPAPDRTAEASAFVELLVDDKFAQAVSKFDATMTRALPEEKLREAWKSVSAAAGQFESHARVTAEKHGQYDVVIVTAKFARALLDIKVVLDSDGRIAGLFFLPSQPPPTLKPPPYARPEAFVEREITIGSGEWALGGTLTMPAGDGPFAAVILVHGSGPQDRNEMIGPNLPFRDLAWGLASRGVAVLRYDKRTKAHAAKLRDIQRTLTVHEETIDDALEAARLLRATPKIDSTRVFILGHSLGGMLVPRMAQRDRSVAGFIILAGTTRPLEDVIVEQIAYIQALGGASIEDVAKSREDAEKVKSLDAASDEIVMGVPAAYWRDLRDYRPVVAAKEIRKPLLILQGERDYQVTMLDFKNWKDALGRRRNVRLKSYPDLNHLFMTGEGKATPAEYHQQGYVAEEVIDDIATWIEECCPRAKRTVNKL